MSEIVIRSVVGLLVAFALMSSSIVLGVARAPDDRLGQQEELSGRARIIDGDTLEIRAERVRLEGIDAPEISQTCQDRFGKSWLCGKVARDWLRRRIARQHVHCTSYGRDRYGRLLAECMTPQGSLNRELVRRGLAWAFVKYSRRYVDDEARARSQALGIWQNQNAPAWAFRANRWASAETQAPEGCAVKGNISAGGRIYHMPWSRWYSRVRINEAKGERWFCSEGEAEAAGFRPALQQ